MLDFLEQHAAGIVLLLLIAFAVEALIALWPRRRNGRDSQGGTLDILSRAGDEVQILFARKGGKVRFVSENATRILGIRPSYLYADLYALAALMTAEEQHRVKNELDCQLKEGEAGACELIMTKLDGSEPMHVRMSVQVTEGEKVLLTLRDISEENAIREGLKKEIIEIKSIDESKTMFLSKMSHEIRTPMNGMLGMISLARLSQAQDKPAEVADYLDKAEGLTQFLLSIINDILDMSRIESGKLELEKAPFSLPGMVEKLRTMFNTTITAKGIEYKSEMLDFTVQNVIGDELRITQVITNFLSNASKFTSAGGHITLTLRQMELRGDKVSFMIRVKDDGVGMTPEFLHRIFIPFEQEDSGIARKYGGSGLGMAISDNLVKAMGGQILVNSEYGKGSEFTFFLDLPVAETTEKVGQKQQTAAIELKGLRLLMAEDNDVNAKVAVKLLEHRGLKMERVADGQQAVDAFEAHEPGYYAAILMDIHMPVMDGWTATKTIRALPREDAKTIPILALSADAFVEDKRHSVEIGMNGHIAKPIDYDELQQALEQNIITAPGTPG